MKKQFLFKRLLIIILLFRNFVIPVSAETNSDIALVNFNEKLELTNIQTAVMGDTEAPVRAKYDDVECWLMDCLKGNSSRYINLTFKDSFVDDITAEYKFEIDYYDYGTGYFGYYYDSVESDNRFGKLFYLENQKKWRTAEFTLNNAEFKKGIDGKYDFRLTINAPLSNSCKTSSSSVAISRIKVTKTPLKNPVYVTADIDESGNTFSWFSDKKIIHNHFVNRTENELNVNVRYVALAEESQTTLFDKTEQLTLKAGEKLDKDLDISEYDTCNLYNYYVYITGNNISSEFIPLQFAVIKTDPNGIKNRNVYMGNHIWKYDNYEEGIDVISKTNIGGMRIDVPWWYVESPDSGAGNYTLWGTPIGNLIEGYLEKDVQVLPLITSQSFVYTSRHDNFPSTEVQLTAYRKLMKYLGEEFAKKGVEQFEIWNEPDVHNGAILDDGVTEMGGASYVPVYNIAKEELKKANPNAKVMGAATCWADSSDIFLQAALDAGWAKTIDVFSGHPYYRNPDEKTVAAESVKKWKDKIAEYGGPEDIEVWDSEVGLTTADSSVGTVKNQANWLARKCIYMRSMDAGDVVGLFKFEMPGIVEYDREDMYGTAYPYNADELFNCKPYTPKISLLEVAAECYVMADSEPVGIFDKDENVRIYKYKSNKFNKDVIPLYSVNTEDIVTLELGAQQLDYYDEFGNMETLYSDDGIYTFTVDERPMYLVGDFPKLNVLENNKFNYSKLVVNSSKNDVASINVFASDNKNYEIEVECGNGLETVSNNGFNGNVALAEIGVSLEKNNNSYVTFRVKNGEKTVQKSQIKIISNDVVVSNLKAEMADKQNLNRWNGEMTIENASQTRAAKGYIQFTYPESFAKLSKIDIGIIPKGKTGVVKFNLPEIAEKGAYNVNYDIVLNSGEKISSSAKIDFTLAVYAETKPKIDGIIEKNEWAESSAMFVNKESQYKSLIKTEPWRGTNDLSGKFVVEWDEENFYLMADITDDVQYNEWNGKDTWRGDSLQVGIYFGSQGYIVAGQGATTFHQITIAQTPNGPEAYRHLSQNNSYEVGYYQNYECAITRKGNHTYYEFMIPWSSLLKPGDQPKEGNSLGFSAMVNDNDGTGRRGWLEYASGIGEAKDTSLFTAIKLIR